MNQENPVYYQYYNHRKLLSNIQIECIKTLKSIYEQKIDYMMRLYEKEIISMQTHNTALKRCISQLMSSIMDNDSDDGEEDDGLLLDGSNISCEPFMNDSTFSFCDSTTSLPTNDDSITNPEKKSVDPLKIVEEVLKDDRNLGSLNMEQLIALQEAIVLARKKYFANQYTDQSLLLNRCLDFSLLKQRIKKVENELSRTCLRLENCKSLEMVNSTMPIQQSPVDLNESLMKFNQNLEATIREKDILNNELKLKLSKFENIAELDSNTDDDSNSDEEDDEDAEDGDDDDEEEAAISRRSKIKAINNGEVIDYIINKDNTIQRHRYLLFNDHL